jgi:rod shape determining protein RodA
VKIRDLLDVDYSLLFSAAVLSVFGILFIYSSGINSEGVNVSNEYVRQIIWASMGFAAALALAFINYRRLYNVSLYLYIAVLALLVYTMFFGRTINGARSWLGIGPVGIQPSEFAKIITIVFLARYLDGSRKNENQLLRFIIACIIVLIPMGLILLQPDFGTSLVFIPILLVTTFVSRMKLQYIAFLFFCIVFGGALLVLPIWQEYILGNTIPALDILESSRFVAIAVGGLVLITLIAILGFLRLQKRYFYWIFYVSTILIISLGVSFVGRSVLAEYQIMRLIVFLDPNVDPRGAGWNIIQSVTAIGSGGLWGKGYLEGTQSHYQYLPQQSTDFIFSIFSEEWGFVGGLLVFVLFLIICLRLIRVMRTSSDLFGQDIAAGISGMFIFHFLINVGMTMGIMPITGIPLLFMSYGGSAMLTAWAGIGLALSIFMRRHIRSER